MDHNKKNKSADKYRNVIINNRNNDNNKKKISNKIIILLIFLVAIISGVSYAFYYITVESDKNVEVVAGTFKIKFNEGNSIKLNKVVPMSDKEGLNDDSNMYTFSIKNEGSIAAKYNLYLEETVTSNSLDKKYIRYSIQEDDGEWSSPMTLSEGLKLRDGKILEPGEVVNYKLKLWVEKDADNSIQGKEFNAKVVVDSVQSNVGITNKVQPIIKISNTSITLYKGEKFIEPEPSDVVDANGNIIDKSEVTKTYEYYDGENTVSVDSVDTSKVGVYYIYYRVKDKEGNEGCTVVTVNVCEKTKDEPPVITLNGENTIEIVKGGIYEELGAKATDKEDGDLTKEIKIEGTVNTNIEGIQVIKYIVIDSSGNTASVSRTVNVIHKGTISISTEEVVRKNDKYYLPTIIKSFDSKIVGVYISKSSEKPMMVDFEKVEETELLKKEFEISENGTYYIWVLDTENNEESKEVEVKGIDLKAPECKFSDISYFEYNETNEIELICTDENGIVEKNLIDEDFEISDGSIAAIDSVSGASVVENGYKYTLTIRGTRKDKFTLTLKEGKIYDISGNKNKSVSKEITVSSLDFELEKNTFELGKSEKLPIKDGNNKGELEYKVKDEEIATVDEDGTITGHKVGKTKVVVTDKKTGLKKEIEINIEKTIEIKYEKNGYAVTKIADLTSENKTCKLTAENPESCEITLPTFEVKNGYTAMGWSENKEANTYSENKTTSTGYVSGGIKIQVSDSMTLYTITAKNEETYKATFKENGAKLEGNKEPSCSTEQVFNIQSEEEESRYLSCTIQAPTIVAGSNENTPIVVGFTNTPVSDEDAKNAKEAQLDSGATLTLNSNNTNRIWYAVTRNDPKTNTVTYQVNEKGIAKEATLNNIQELNTTCTIESSYNGQEQKKYCQVQVPDLIAKEGYTALGWSQNKEAKAEITKEDVTAENGYISVQGTERKPLSVSSDVEVYSIYKKDSITLTATFIKSGDPVDKISTNQLSCETPETYNEEDEITSCTIEAPTMTVKEGYTAIGWSKNKDATEEVNDEITLDDGYIRIGENITLTENISLFSISKKDEVTYNAIFKPNGALLNGDKQDVNISCTIEEVWNKLQDKNCKPEAKTPEITREGFSIIGFDINENATERTADTIDDNSEFNLDSNKTYYAITNKLITIHWDGNGATAGSTSTSCTIYNNSSKCKESITVPSITRDGYEIKGWNKDSTAHDGDPEWAVGKTKILDINDNNTTLYAITEKQNSATFYYNGDNDAQKEVISTCKMYNQDDKCDYDIPEEVVESTGPEGVKYAGVSSEINNKDNVLTPDSKKDKYYAYYEDKVDINFHYYDFENQEQTLITSKGTKSSTTNGDKYTITNGEVNVPSAVTDSTGPDESKYINVSKDTNNTTPAEVTTLYKDYYAYYQGIWTTYFNNQNGDIVKLSIATSTDGTGSLSCNSDKVSNGESYESKPCNITTPTITVGDEYINNGWSKNREALDGTPGGSQISVNENDTYYTIIGKKAITNTATFYLNGAGTQTKEDGSAVEEDVTRSCIIPAIQNMTVQTQDTTCTIKTPKVTGSDNTPVVATPAYATSDNAIIGTVGQDTDIDINKNEKYYAVTYSEAKTINVTFYKNGADSQTYEQDDQEITKDDDSVTLSCTISSTYNGEKQDETCKIKSPKINASKNTPEVIGYGKTADSHKNELNVETEKMYSADENYYAQTKQEAITFTVKEYKKGSHIESIEKTTEENSECTVKTVYNGAKQPESCHVEPPEVTASKGYTSVGWSLENGSELGTDVITLNKDNTNKEWYANAIGNVYVIAYYDGDTLKGTSPAKVDEYPTLTKAKDMNVTKTGYTFKGWSDEADGEVLYSDGAKLESNLATEKGAVVKLYAVWADETAPVCTWSKIDETTTQNTTTAILTCTDNGSGLQENDLDKDDFEVTSDGEITDINKIESGKYEITLTGLRVGNFTISLNANTIYDNASNGNEKTTSDNVIVKGRTYTVTFTKGTNNSGVDSISSTSESCTTTGESLTCTINPYPTITAKEGYVASTWYNITKDEDTGITSGGDGSSYEIGQDTTMAAQTKTIPTIVMEDKTVKYTGEKVEHHATSNSKGDITYEYYSTPTCDGDVLEEPPTEAGNYSIKATQQAYENFTEGTKCAKIIIEKADGHVELDNKKASIQVRTPSFTFNVEDTHGGAISATTNTDGVQTSVSDDGKQITVSGLENLKVGTTVTVTVTSGETDNYKEASATYEIVIRNLDAVCPSTTDYEAIYDGNSHKLTVTGGSGGTIKYSKDNINWTETNPEFTDVVDQVIYIKMEADENHSDVVCPSGKVIIKKKDITVTPLSNQKKIYREQDPELKYSHSGEISGEEAKFSGNLERDPGEDVGEYIIHVGTLALIDNGAFKATNYNLVFSSSEVKFKIDPKQLKDMDVTLESTSYGYDGVAKTPKVTVKDDNLTLEENKDFTVKYEDNIDAGETENGGTAKAIVTFQGNYTGVITKNFSINKRPTTCTSSSKEKVYDGQPLTSPDGGECTDIADGQEATLSNHKGTITDAGETPNTFGDVVIKDASGNDVTKNYSITKKDGVLKVTQSPTAKKATCNDLTYNGRSQTLTSGGMHVTYSVNGGEDSEDNVGTNAGEYTVKVTTDKNHTFDDKTEYHDLTCTINQKPITCTSGNASKIYDGTPLKYDTAPDDETKTIGTCTGLVNDHISTFSDYVGTQTDVGKSDNTYNTVVITSTSGVNETNNYKITKKSGTLTVTKRDLIVTPKSGQHKTYKEKDPELEYTVSNIVEGETAGFTGHLTREEGENVGDYLIKLGTLALADNNDKNFKAENYNLVFSSDSVNFTINQKQLTDNNMTLSTTAVVYNGQYQQPEVTVKDTDEEVLKFDVDYTIEYKNNLDAGVATVEVTLKGNYTGKLTKTFTINQRKVTYKADDKSKVYDGTPLTANNATLQDETSLATDHTAEFDITSSITDAGEIDNVINSVTIKDADGNDVTKNYEITMKNGKLTVTRAPQATSAVCNQNLIYNGDSQDLTKDGSHVDYTVTDKNNNSKTLTAENTQDAETPNGTNAGDYTITVTPNKNYAFEDGSTKQQSLTCTINQKPITCTSGNAEKVYDETPLKYDTALPDQIKSQSSCDGLVKNHKSEFSGYTGTQTDAGESENTFKKVVIKSNDGNTDETDNYNITTQNGTLTVKKSPTAVKPVCQSQIYSGAEQLLTKNGKYVTYTTTYNGQTSNDNYGVDAADEEGNEIKYQVTATTDKNHTFDDNTEETTVTCKIIKREITYKADDETRNYNGLPLTKKTATLTSSTPLVDDHNAIFDISGTITDVGTQTNTLNTVTIKDSSQNDVTRNYNIHKQNGTLTVTKQDIIVTPTANQYKTYKEEDPTLNYVYVGNQNNETAEFEGKLARESGEDAGTYHINLGTLKLVNSKTTDNKFKASNYELKLDPNIVDFQIIAKELKDNELNMNLSTTAVGYNGKEHGGNNHGNDIIITVKDGNDTLVENTDYNVTYENNINAGMATVKVSLGGTAHNYSGNLQKQFTINKRKVVYKADNGEKVYDGTPLTKKTATLILNDGSTTLADKEKAEFSITGELTDVAYDNSGQVTTVPNVLNSVTIKDETGKTTTNDGRDIAETNYNVVKQNGTLKVTRRPDATSPSCNSSLTEYNGANQNLTSNGHHVNYTITSVKNGTPKTLTSTATNDAETPKETNADTYTIKSQPNKNYTYTDGKSDEKTITCTINKRPVTYKVENQTKTYDGKTLTNGDVKLTSGTIVTGQTATTKTNGTITNVGNTQNIISVSVADSSGNDVTPNYQITTQNGTLTINKRKMTCTADSMSFVYDGNSHSDNKASCAATNGDTGLAPGQSATLTTSGSITDVKFNDDGSIGNVANTISNISITDASNNQILKDNYDITQVNGTLTVNKRSVTCTANSKTFTYDGQAHSLTGTCESANGTTGIVSGQSATVTTNGTATNATNGSPVTSTISSVKITDKSNNDKTSNYSINNQSGIITIDRAKTAVKPTCQNLTYNGKSQTLMSGGSSLGNYSGNSAVTAGDHSVTATTDNNHTFSDDGKTSYTTTCSIKKQNATCTAASDNKVYDGTALTHTSGGTCTGIVNNEGYTITDSGSQTDAGASNNNITNVTVNGDSNASNYNITRNPGTLTVTQRPVTCTASNSSKEYDGQALNTPNTGSCNVASGTTGLVSGHTPTFSETGSITNAGSTTNTLNSVTIKNGGTDVTNNYNITRNPGTLTITKRPISCTAEGASKVYDGTALTHTSGGTCNNVVANQSVDVINTGSITTVGTANNTISDVKINSVSVGASNSNYTLQSKTAGTLSVTQRSVTCTAGSNTVIYTGNSQSATGGTCNNQSGTTGIVSGQSATVTSSVSGTNAGSYTNNISNVTIKSGGTDVTSNYSISKNTGTLTINQAKSATTGSCSNPTYNGTSQKLMSGGAFVTYSNNDATNATTSQTVTITTDNNHQFSDGQESKTQNCSLNKKSITCTAGSKSKEYDGTSLSAPNGSCATVASGETATVTSSGSITDAGETPTSVSNVTITKSGTSTKDNYNITTSGGKLNISKRTTTCIAGSNTYTYDGAPHFASNGSCDRLVTGHIATVSSNESRTDSGDTTTNVSSISIKSGSADVTSNYEPTKKSGNIHIDPRTNTVKFYNNGNTVSGANNSDYVSKTCSQGNGNGCKVSEPTISHTGFDIVKTGWATSQNTTNYDHNYKSEYTTTSPNTSFYALADAQVDFEYNTSTNMSTHAENGSATCTINTPNGCNVSVPSEVANSTAPTNTHYLGVSKTTNSSTTVSTIPASTQRYYAVYKNNPRTIHYCNSTNGSGKTATSDTYGAFYAEHQSGSSNRYAYTTPTAASPLGSVSGYSFVKPNLDTEDMDIEESYTKPYTVYFNYDESSVERIGATSATGNDGVNAFDVGNGQVMCNGGRSPATTPSITPKRGYSNEKWYFGGNSVSPGAGVYNEGTYTAKADDTESPTVSVKIDWTGTTDKDNSMILVPNLSGDTTLTATVTAQDNSGSVTKRTLEYWEYFGTLKLSGSILAQPRDNIFSVRDNYNGWLKYQDNIITITVDKDVYVDAAGNGNYLTTFYGESIYLNSSNPLRIGPYR